MRPGQVSSDAQAFEQILRRFSDEVGSLLALVDRSKLDGTFFPNTAPFWALVRMMFPVAESIGALIYSNSSTVKNLRGVLEKEFDAERPGYAGKSAAIAFLYRHALTHQDELESQQSGGRELGWVLR